MYTITGAGKDKNLGSPVAYYQVGLICPETVLCIW